MHELRKRRKSKQPEILRSGRNLELISYRSVTLSDVHLEVSLAYGDCISNTASPIPAVSTSSVNQLVSCLGCCLIAKSHSTLGIGSLFATPESVQGLATGEKLYIRMMAVAAAFLFGNDLVKLRFKRTPLPEPTVH
jgi:hypothetical protein